MLLAKQQNNSPPSVPRNDQCSQCSRLQNLINVLNKKQSNRFESQFSDLYERCFPRAVSLTLDEKLQTIEEALSGQDCKSATALNNIYAQFKQEKEAFEIQKREKVPKSEEIAEDLNSLKRQLESLEVEKDMAEQQIRDCNFEFLDLREKLTNAIFERDHTKQLLHDCDLQLKSLEHVLKDNNQQLLSARQQIDYLRRSTSDSHVVRLQDYVEEAKELETEPLLPIYLRWNSFFQSARSSFLSFVVKARKHVPRMVIFSKKPSLLMFLLCYVAILHFLIIKCLLFQATTASEDLKNLA
ncbi:hypothetical protein Ciccas_001665 [Cichlidogyrus casuarinus]|uniref:Uncharacterized protein n=1 Tax=Cichlidogyrus casuarinus TaxID=1844966 RepID=A0ABD2QJH6_9PLAT